MPAASEPTSPSPMMPRVLPNSPPISRNAGPVVGDVVIRAYAVAVPAILAHRVVGLEQPLAEREHHQDRVLGGELQRRARHARDQDAACTAAARSMASARAPMRWISLSFGLASISAASIAPRRKIRIVGVAARAQVELRRHRNERYAVGSVQAAADRVHAPDPSPRAGRTRAPRLSVISPGPEMRVAGEADDVVVVEDGNRCAGTDFIMREWRRRIP